MLRLQIAQYEYDNAEVIACAKAIKELGYDLYGDFRKLFLDEGINDPSNKEVIFKVNYAEDLRSSYMTQLWYNWFSFNTTLEMVNSFFTANGLPVKPLEADNGASIPADPTYDKDYPFENRDPRLKLSVLCPATNTAATAPPAIRSTGSPPTGTTRPASQPKRAPTRRSGTSTTTAATRS